MSQASQKEWRPVPGFPGYERTRFGEYRSVSYGGRWGVVTRNVPRPVGVQYDDDGYARVYLRRGGRTVKLSRARGVLEDNVGPCPSDLEACHKNGQPADDRPDNLYWGTRKQNAADRKTHGTEPHGDAHWARRMPERLARGDRSGSRTHPGIHRGESNGRAHLTEERVRAIIASLESGYGPSRTAREHGVPVSSVSDIKLNRSWKHIPRTALLAGEQR